MQKKNDAKKQDWPAEPGWRRKATLTKTGSRVTGLSVGWPSVTTIPGIVAGVAVVVELTVARFRKSLGDKPRRIRCQDIGLDHVGLYAKENKKQSSSHY